MSPPNLNHRTSLGALLGVLLAAAPCKALASFCSKYSKLLNWIAPPAALLTDTHSVVEFVVMLKDFIPLI